MKLTSRILSICLCTALLMSPLLSGCNKDKTESSAETNHKKSENAVVIFGKEPISKGMTYKVDSKKSLSFGDVLNKEYTKLKKGDTIKFKLNDDFVKKFNGKSLFIKLEYFDSNGKEYKIKYDDEKGSVDEKYAMTATNQWSGRAIKTNKIKLSNESEFDFSLSLDTASSMWLRSVTVSENNMKENKYPQLLKTDYFTSNGKVIDADIRAFGAVGDGVTEDDAAFQTALQELSGKGGVLYVPAGRYKLTQDMIIPSGVTLLGDFNRPSRSNPKVSGTVLAIETPTIADGNKNSFLTLKAGSCIKGLSFWYPNQTLSSGRAEPYNYTVGITDNIGVVIEDVYLVNSYDGISHKNGDVAHYQAMTKNVYGTPLHTGYMSGKATDSDRHQFFDFSPKFWLGSGLPGAPEKKVLENWLITYGVGFNLGDIDFHYVSDINIEGYKIGMNVYGFFGRIYNFNITDCNVCMYIDEVAMYGGQMTNGVLKANGGKNPVGLLVGESVKEGFTGTNVEIESTGDYAINYLGEGNMALQECKATVTGKDSVSPVHSIGGRISLMNTVLSGGINDASFEKGIGKSTLVNCSSANGKLNVKNDAGDKLSIINDSESNVDSLDLKKLSIADERRQYQNRQPQTQTLYNVVDYGAKANTESPADISTEIQKAIDEAASNGGGVVYIPSGDYRLEKPVVVKSGVVLLGANDYFHYCLDSLHYSTLLTDYGKEKGKAQPLITLQENAGIRGLSIIYDKVTPEKIVPYATTIQATGKDGYVINTTVVGGYYIADFNTNKCDNHYIESLNFFTFGTGIAMGGGSENGVLLNGHSNPGEMWSTGYNKNKWSGDWDGPLITNALKHVNSFYYGNCKNQAAFMTATFGTKYGVKIDDGADLYLIGHGTDFSVNDIYITGNANAVIIDPQCIGANSREDYMSNAIVADKNFTGKLSVYNLCGWNINDAAVRVDGGTVSINGATFLKAGKAPVIVTGGSVTLNGAIVKARSSADIKAESGTDSVTAFGNIIAFTPYFDIKDGVSKYGSDLK